MDGDGITKSWKRNWFMIMTTTTAKTSASIQLYSSVRMVFFLLFSYAFSAFLFVRYFTVALSRNVYTLSIS